MISSQIIHFLFYGGRWEVCKQAFWF